MRIPQGSQAQNDEVVMDKGFTSLSMTDRHAVRNNTCNRGLFSKRRVTKKQGKYFLPKILGMNDAHTSSVIENTNFSIRGSV